MNVPPPAPYPMAPGAPQPLGTSTGPEAELQMLKSQAQAAEEQLRSINARIKELEQVSKPATLVAVVDPEKCTGCGLCENACPVGAISVDDIARVEPDKCTACGRCVEECPQEALSLRRR